MYLKSAENENFDFMGVCRYNYVGNNLSVIYSLSATIIKKAQIHYTSEEATIHRFSQNFMFKIIEHVNSYDNIRNCVTNYVEFCPTTPLPSDSPQMPL